MRRTRLLPLRLAKYSVGNRLHLIEWLFPSVQKPVGCTGRSHPLRPRVWLSLDNHLCLIEDLTDSLLAEILNE